MRYTKFSPTSSFATKLHVKIQIAPLNVFHLLGPICATLVTTVAHHLPGVVLVLVEGAIGNVGASSSSEISVGWQQGIF